MGYYIETDKNLDKAKQIADKFNGKIVSYHEARAAMEDSTKGVICVVRNAFFEAAGYAFNMEEFNVLTRRDDIRPKQYVVISKEDAMRESGYGGLGEYR